MVYTYDKDSGFQWTHACGLGHLQVPPGSPLPASDHTRRLEELRRRIPFPHISRLCQNSCWLGSGNVLFLGADLSRENSMIWMYFKIITFPLPR